MKKRIIFVCLGNICRSPAAEGVMKKLVRDRGLTDSFHIESAGTAGYHVGEPPDHRMRKAAQARGFSLESRAQQFSRQHLESFDLILAADQDNLFHIHAMDADGTHREKIHLLLEWGNHPHLKAVPDPYYGGPDGFEHVLDLLEDACASLLDDLTSEDQDHG